jgi:hypothetical protein
MHVINDIYTKFSIEDLNKILKYGDIRPTWGITVDGYVKTLIEKKFIYLHQYIMNTHENDNTDLKETIDHINRDKLDNRKENLRIATMAEQIENRDKMKRQKNAIALPQGIIQSDLPKYVIYGHEIYNKNKFRDWFYIEHPKLDKIWYSSKSDKFTSKDKLEQAKLKLKHINKEITDEQYKNLTETIILPPNITLSIDKRTNKYTLNIDKREKVNGERKTVASYKMTLKHNDLQIELDRFINEINIKYENLKLEQYKLDKPYIIDFSNVSNVIEEEKVEIQEKYKIKPDLPTNICLTEENNIFTLKYNKHIEKTRYTCNHVLETMNIQKELDKFIDKINIRYPTFNIEKYIVKTPYDFTDDIILNKKEFKPELQQYFTICKVNNIDYIQYQYKNGDNRQSMNIKINTFDLQNLYEKFIDRVNTKYNLNYQKNKIDIKDWKTTNIIK